MTAEAVVMNKTAVAMAADSAVTVSDDKVFNSATKIFALSYSEPVGAMLYGQGELLGVPWETVVKLFRDDLGDEAYGSLQGYAEALLQFLSVNTEELFPDQIQAEYAERKSRFFLDEMVRHISEAVNDRLNENADHDEAVDDEDIRSAIRDETATAVAFYEDLFQTLREDTAEPDDQLNDIRNSYCEVLEELVDSVFGALKIGDGIRGQILNLCVEAIRLPSVPRCPDTWSGIVVVGFGRDDLFPRLRPLTIWGVAANHLLHSPLSTEEGIDIGFDYPAAVRAFAQGEMIHTFMEGVDPDYQIYLEKQVGATLSGFVDGVTELLADRFGVDAEDVASAMEALATSELEALAQRLTEHRKNTHVGPIVNVVSVLPKSELAELADALVSLTSLKRKVTNVQETVGGPIDVAIISKKDGLVWIKRKHYFTADLNPHFMARYLGGQFHER